MTNDVLLLNALLPATDERMYAALTRPQDLMQWYSQQAELEAVPGAVGRFEGKDGHFLETWTIDAMTPPRLLVVSWASEADLLAEVRLQVTFALTPEGHATRCQITARSLGGSPDAVQGALDEWARAIACLQIWLEDEEEEAFAVNSSRLEIELSAPRERVWQALTDPDTLKQWFWLDADLTPAAGSPFRLRGLGQSRADDGRVVRVRPLDMLVFDWYDGCGAARRVYWKVSDETRWSIQDGPFEAADRWRQPLCEIGWRSAQTALQQWLSRSSHRPGGGAETFKKLGDESSAPHTEPREYVVDLSSPTSLESTRSRLEMVHEVPLAGSVEDGWQALADPDRLIRWLAESGTDTEPVSLRSETGVRMTWLLRVGSVQTAISVRLETREDTVWLRVHHWGFLGHDELRQRYDAFWPDALARMQAVLAPPHVVSADV